MAHCLESSSGGGLRLIYSSSEEKFSSDISDEETDNATGTTLEKKVSLFLQLLSF